MLRQHMEMLQIHEHHGWFACELSEFTKNEHCRSMIIMSVLDVPGDKSVTTDRKQIIN